MSDSAIETPAFLVWSLQRRCGLRGTEPQSPTQVERLLRGVREISIARREGRSVDGVVLHRDNNLESPATSLGFAESEIFAPFGGEEQVGATCQTCPINISQQYETSTGSSLQVAAGCYGIVAFCGELTGWLDGLESILANENLARDHAQLFIQTSPRHQSLWSRDLIGAEQARFLAGLIRQTIVDQQNWLDTTSPLYLGNGTLRELLEFAKGLSFAHAEGQLLQLEYYPAGVVRGRSWDLPAQCQRCRAGRVDQHGSCPVCRYPSPTPNKVHRKSRGNRPYLPLVRFLGAERTEKLLNKYRNSSCDQ